MEQRQLGRTGIVVSALGFGAGSIGGLFVRGDPAEQRRAVARAIEGGITYFDTAPRYGDGRSEENLGRVLRDLDAWGRVTVGTKVRLEPDDLADPVAAIARSVEESLRRLGRASIDLLQLHNPIIEAVSGGDGERTLGVSLDTVREAGAIAEGLRQVQQRGLVRHVGFTGLGDSGALRAAAERGGFAIVQAYFNAINPSAGYSGAHGGEQDFAGLIDVAAGAGLGVIAIRVMAAGALAARTERHPNAGNPGHALADGAEYGRDLARADGLARLAREAGLESPAELAVRFALAKPGVSTVLVGYSDAAQLEDALRWAAQGPLPDDLTRRVVALASAGQAAGSTVG